MAMYQNLLFTGVILSWILAVLFFIRRKRLRGNIYFSVYLFVLSLFLLMSMASTRRIDLPSGTVLLLAGLTAVLLFLSGPLLYLYLEASAFGTERRSLVLLLPSGVIFLFILFLIPFAPGEGAPIPERFYGINLFLLATGYGYMIFCYLKTLILYRRYRREIKETHSDPERLRLTWFGFLIIFVLLTSCADLAARAAEAFLPAFQHDYQILDLLETAFLLIISFFALLQPELLQDLRRDEQDARGKYSSSSLTERERTGLYRQLEQLMETEKPYKEEISLPALADRLDMSVHTLSQVINTSGGGNFQQFINRYRVQEVLRLMEEESDSMTFLDMAYEAGFNSKTAFYKFFKRETGETPSSYLNKTSKS